MEKISKFRLEIITSGTHIMVVWMQKLLFYLCGFRIGIKVIIILKTSIAAIAIKNLLNKFS